MPSRPPRRLVVACLCAAWCDACRAYRSGFDALAARSATQEGAADATRFVWIDIEDEAAMLGEFEVENFPTLLIADGPRLLFIGPLAPQPAVLERLLESARAGTLVPPTDTPEGEALAARLAADPPRGAPGPRPAAAN